jgi:hypothetical protein
MEEPEYPYRTDIKYCIRVAGLCSDIGEITIDNKYALIGIQPPSNSLVITPPVGTAHP